MTVTDLLTRFANPDIIHSLSLSDKLWAGLITTILGMGITFSALIILQFIISLMEKFFKDSGKKITSIKPIAPAIETSPASKPEPKQDDNELVAVIASVIAMKMKTSVSNIVIKNIEKVEDRSPAWNRAGIIEQMNSRF
jgi:glutaconyl-CoA/methylmalonyl-CoA decarboxylase subunit delta